MLISRKWLEQYLPKGIHVTFEKLRERLTNSLAEVEDIIYRGEDLKNIIVGEILELEPHPSAPKLQIVTVDVGQKNKRSIVCAASNIFIGAKVPVALPGGAVFNPKQKLGKQELLSIKIASIKGTKSFGMLCSQKELGLTEDHEGIWILPHDTKVGLDLVEQLSDRVYEIDNKPLTNRPDCFCHVGIARELSAILKTPFQYPQNPKSIIPTKTLPLVVKVEDKKLCKRYCAVAIQGVKVDRSPLWLQIKLLAIGVRPVNNIVDATNYIMFEMGQPIHAFDYNKLKTPRIIVRTAVKGEKIKTLDGQTRELSKNHLLICDPSGPIAIGGIMGGENTEVDEDTQDIIIECANFEMYNIRRSTRELGLRTDASTRFEKGLDPNLAIEALQKVTDLITDLAGGEIASKVIDEYPEKVEEETIEFELIDVPRLLGIEVKKEEIISILQSLQLEVISPQSSTTKLQLKIPTFRRDLHIKEDILEEIARIYGYDKFTPTLPTRSLKPVSFNPVFIFERKLKQLMSSLGFDELYLYSFIGKESYDKTLLDSEQSIKLKNPLSPELSYMRTSHVPALLEKVKLNLSNFDEISIYILGRVYFNGKNEEGLPEQPKYLTALITKDLPPKKLYTQLKGKLEILLSRLHLHDISFVKTENVSFFHPSLKAQILNGKEHIGNIGLLHPKVKQNWKLKYDTVLCTLFADKVFEQHHEYGMYKKVPKYPSVRRDLSFWIDKKIEAEKVLKTLSQVKSDFVQGVVITDIFNSTKNPDKRSFTVQITLQSYKDTLTEKQITSDIQKLVTEIEKMGGEIRGKGVEE